MIAALKALFEPLGAKVHILNHAPTEQTLDLVIAMGGDGLRIPLRFGLPRMSSPHS